MSVTRDNKLLGRDHTEVFTGRRILGGGVITIVGLDPHLVGPEWRVRDRSPHDPQSHSCFESTTINELFKHVIAIEYT